MKNNMSYKTICVITNDGDVKESITYDKFNDTHNDLVYKIFKSTIEELDRRTKETYILEPQVDDKDFVSFFYSYMKILSRELNMLFIAYDSVTDYYICVIPMHISKIQYDVFKEKCNDDIRFQLCVDDGDVFEFLYWASKDETLGVLKSKIAKQR